MIMTGFYQSLILSATSTICFIKSHTHFYSHDRVLLRAMCHVDQSLKPVCVEPLSLYGLFWRLLMDMHLSKPIARDSGMSSVWLIGKLTFWYHAQQVCRHFVLKASRKLTGIIYIIRIHKSPEHDKQHRILFLYDFAYIISQINAYLREKAFLLIVNHQREINCITLHCPQNVSPLFY